MSIKIKQTLNDQTGVFYVMLGLMAFFFVCHMVTDALFQMGATPAQIGGDVSLQTFRELLLIAMMVFKVEGQAVADRIAGVVQIPDGKMEQPVTEPQQ